ncbi:MAG: hypothetical protein H0T92_24770 [Pyrinomonadaceae bacterium]|nr:hypothetical protein [Pyrinomonadaceae bacterium]
MLERELEVVDQAAEEAGDIAIQLASLRDAVDAQLPNVAKQTIATAIERIDNLADVLTALSIDLTHVNRTLKND